MPLAKDDIIHQYSIHTTSICKLTILYTLKLLVYDISHKFVFFSANSLDHLLSTEA